MPLEGMKSIIRSMVNQKLAERTPQYKMAQARLAREHDRQQREQRLQSILSTLNLTDPGDMETFITEAATLFPEQYGYAAMNYSRAKQTQGLRDIAEARRQEGRSLMGQYIGMAAEGGITPEEYAAGLSLANIKDVPISETGFTTLEPPQRRTIEEELELYRRKLEQAKKVGVPTGKIPKWQRVGVFNIDPKTKQYSDTPYRYHLTRGLEPDFTKPAYPVGKEARPKGYTWWEKRDIMDTFLPRSAAFKQLSKELKNKLPETFKKRKKAPEQIRYLLNTGFPESEEYQALGTPDEIREKYPSVTAVIEKLKVGEPVPEQGEDVSIDELLQQLVNP